METQFVINSRGRKQAVLLSIKEYERILEDLDELEDIKLYDEVKARNEDHIPFEEYLKHRKKRKHA